MSWGQFKLIIFFNNVSLNISHLYPIFKSEPFNLHELIPIIGFENSKDLKEKMYKSMKSSKKKMERGRDII